MFYYFGGKRRLAGHYPPPAYDTIVEPFAGGAGYSMFHLQSVRRVVLIEKDERVADTWRRLLAMSPTDLLRYPVPEAGERTSDFLVMTAATSNAIGRCRSMKVTERQPAIVRLMLRRMAVMVEAAASKVEIIHGDYRDAPDVEATWFIDPPYQVNGRSPSGTQHPQGLGYAPSCSADSIDYPALGEWCRERSGQRIVCEQEGATWLPFRHLRGSGDGLGRRATEVCWADPEHQLALM